MYSIQPHSTVLVLNSSYEPLHFTNWKRAVILLFKEKAKVISSSVIRLVNYVIIPYRRMTNMYPTRNLSTNVTRTSVNIAEQLKVLRLIM